MRRRLPLRGDNQSRTFSRRGWRSILAAAAALSISGAARAEPVGRFSFRSYGPAQGLENLVVQQIAQDTDGYIWVGTEDGVYRYDGDRFHRYGVPDGLPGSSVSALAVGKDGRFWVGTWDGLARWDGPKLHALQEQSGLPARPVRALVASNDGLFVAVGPWLYRETSPDHFEPVAGWVGREATALWVDSDGTLIAAAGAEAHVLHEGTWKTLGTEVGLGVERLDGIARDGAGTLWVRSARHLWSKKPEQARFEEQTWLLPGGSESGTLLVDRHGFLWVPTDRGFLYQQQAGWAVLGGEQGLPTLGARTVFEDREGSLWVGSAGLHQLLGRGLWRTYSMREGLPDDLIWTVSRDPAGTLWVGTDASLAREGVLQFELVPGTEHHAIRSVARGADGALWLGGTPPEVLRHVPRTGAVERMNWDLGQAQKILRLLVDHEGRLWVGTHGGGLFVLVWGRPQRVPLPGGSPTEVVSSLIEDSEGRIWAGGEQGLAVLQEGQWRRLTAADGLRESRVRYLLERRNGEICAAYFESLGLSCFRFDGKTLSGIRHINTETALASDRVYLMGEDVEERLWIGTGQGVDVIGPRGVEHFGQQQGLPGDDVAAMSFHAGANGDVWIGTSTGLGRFAGARYVAPPEAPRPALVTARLGGRLVPNGAAAPLTVPHGESDFEVHFAGLSFLDTGRIEHHVRLAPLESEWRAIAVREARYKALPPGSYTFELRARLPFGPWSDSAKLSFVVLPAWWQTLWFRLALAVCATTGLLFVGRWQLRAHEGRREQQLRRRAEASFRALIEQTPDAIFVFRDRLIVYANPSAVRSLGLERAEELLGSDILDLVHPDERAPAESRIRQVTETGEVAPLQERRFVRKDGSTVTMELVSLKVEFGGAASVLAVARDVTERKRMEARLLLSDRMASIGTLAAGVMHEINNPLAYVTANLDLIAEQIRFLKLEPPPPELAELNESIADAREGAARMREIVQGLKSFSRAQEEKRCPLEIAKALDVAIQMTATEVRHRARVVKEYGPVPLVLADQTRLAQVFINLLVNAAHAMPDGHADRNEIRLVTYTDASGRAVVEVRDTGSGIPPHIVRRIFDPFFTTKPVGFGTGLGLSICHGIVSALGGEIGVESEVGRGTVFRVALPAAAAEAAVERQARVPQTSSERRGRVLVVDDDAKVATAVRKALAQEHDVEVVATGEDALQRFATGERYDVIFSDLMMPTMTGMELHQELAKNAPDQAERMVFITGGLFTPSARAFLDKIPNPWLEKPFDLDRIRSVVRQTLS